MAARPPDQSSAKADTSADLTLKVRNASAVVTSSVIATLVNDTIYEAAFEVLPGGDVVGGLAVSGYRPGGGTGSTTDPRFPRVRLTAPTKSILLQSPFVSLASGAAAGAKTGKVDFIGAFRER